MTAALEASRVSVSYGAVEVLESVDLSVERGEWLGVIGPNGAGKTTLLRALAGLIDFEGTVFVEGVAVRRSTRREIARQVAFVPQQPLLPQGLTVAEYLFLGRTPHLGYLGVEGRTDADIVRGVMAELELALFATRRLDSLSGGELQRAVIGRALVQKAPVLLLDEPTTALDIGRQQEVLDLVQRLRSDRRVTVVSAMHDLTMAGQFAERIVLMDGGAVVADGSAPDVISSELISRHYAASVEVIIDDEGGVVVIPRRTPSPREPAIG